MSSLLTLLTSSSTGVAPIDPRSLFDWGWDYKPDRFATGTNTQMYVNSYGVPDSVGNNGGFLQLRYDSGLPFGEDAPVCLAGGVDSNGPTSIRSVLDNYYTLNTPYVSADVGGLWGVLSENRSPVRLISPAVGTPFLVQSNPGDDSLAGTYAGPASEVRGVVGSVSSILAILNGSSPSPFLAKTIFGVVSLADGGSITVAGQEGADSDAFTLFQQNAISQDYFFQAAETHEVGGLGLPLGVSLFAVRKTPLAWEIRLTGYPDWVQLSSITSADEFDVQAILTAAEQTTNSSGCMAGWYSTSVLSDAQINAAAAFYAAEADVGVGW